MKFYYENHMGDSGKFREKCLIKAIYAAWNIDADLYIIQPDGNQQLVFAPLEPNEFNSDILKEFGYYMIDGDKEREIREIKNDTLRHYEWSDVKQLV